MREFNFRKPNAVSEGMFTVDVSDDRGNRIIFKMQKEDKNWKIIEQSLPVWITEKEAQLHDLIEEEMSRG